MGTEYINDSFISVKIDFKILEDMKIFFFR